MIYDFFHWQSIVSRHSQGKGNRFRTQYIHAVFILAFGPTSREHCSHTTSNWVWPLLGLASTCPWADSLARGTQSSLLSTTKSRKENKTKQFRIGKKKKVANRYSQIHALLKKIFLCFCVLKYKKSQLRPLVWMDNGEHNRNGKSDSAGISRWDYLSGIGNTLCCQFWREEVLHSKGIKETNWRTVSEGVY